MCVDATPPDEQNGLISGAARMNGSNQVRYALSHAIQVCDVTCNVARSQSRLPSANDTTATEVCVIVTIR